MRFNTLVVAGALALGPWLAFAQADSIPAGGASIRMLSLDEAWRLADEANPALKRKTAQREAVDGALQDASALLYNNPQLSLEGTRRQVPQPGRGEDRRREWSAGLSQTFEIAGQRGHRLAAAEAAHDAQVADIETSRRELRGLVAQQFYRVLAQQQRVALETKAVGLFEDTATAVQKRRAAGEDTKLDATVATVEAERARSQLDAAREQLIEVRSELAALLQLSPGIPFEAQGDLARNLARPLPTLDRLIGSLSAQPRLRSLAAQEDSARARLALERASRIPDLTLGIAVGREGPDDARERLTTLSLSVPLPLFKRNSAGIGQAGSELTQAQIEHQAALRDGESAVRALGAKLDSLQRRARRLQETVVPALSDNEQLSVKSQRAGQIGLLELIVVSRQALDARRDLIDALLDYQTSRLALELAAGQPLDTDEGFTK